MEQPLYDLSPVLHIMLMGVVVALGPLSWMWLRNKKAVPARRLQALTLLVLFLTFDLVLFGAFTRLTDSGLGCPDWPGCYGQASPTGAHAQISEAQAAMPTGPVTHQKAWIEMIHRYLATAVGVLILTLTAGTWVLRRRGAAVSPWWPTVTLVWVSFQGALGAWTVTMKLFPAVVTMHLLAGLVLLALLCRQAVAYEHAQQGRSRVAIAPRLRTWLVAATALAWLQAALGGWVSTNYAVLACSDFPACQGSWWPTMDFRQGFELWRELGMTGGGEHVGFAALTAIHYAHRLAAYVVLAVLGLLAWQLARVDAVQRQARLIGGLAVWQLASGVSNVLLDWPVLVAVAHTGGAAGLVLVLTWALAETRRSVSRQPRAAGAARERSG
ncbi:heme A synthase [Ramlibacter sp. RBP-2]|uniref:Heme A synthase n=1 Tax=Ramlibacter lithotrophicus TaxID=2606681 RepID=A0A7X6DIA2_9BURK|nr:COX15/CtaA family protein [Ramlibacter lithotrophicus]NKE67672.1 heme A synthase [Ramlibacter lithotrophicus]